MLKLSDIPQNYPLYWLFSSHIIVSHRSVGVYLQSNSSLNLQCPATMITITEKF